jgi:hypothetical protein
VIFASSQTNRLRYEGSDYARAVQELNEAIERANELLQS